MIITNDTRKRFCFSNISILTSVETWTCCQLKYFVGAKIELQLSKYLSLALNNFCKREVQTFTLKNGH